MPLSNSYRLLNHGPTVLVSVRHDGLVDVMAAAWACVLDYGQTPRVTVVLDKATRTRELVEASGAFALQLPTRAMAAGISTPQPTTCAPSITWPAGSTLSPGRWCRGELGGGTCPRHHFQENFKLFRH